jgi:hypothetical protein
VAASVISAKLDLVVRLIDTTTGAIIDERNVLFMRDGEPCKPEPRGSGVYIFINTGREDFLMQIKVYGYDDFRKEVHYEELDERQPTVNVFLMPSENTSKGEEVLCLSGTLPFIKNIEAVNLNASLCLANEFDKKKKTMKVFRAGGSSVDLDDIYYGLLHTDKMNYEKIEVTGSAAPQSVILKEAIQEEFSSNSPIMRILFGSVDEDGHYVLKVRDNAKDIRYLVRYEVGDEVRFQTVDFRNLEALK